MNKLLLAACGVALLAGHARADRIAIALTPAQQALQADAIVVGKVVEWEAESPDVSKVFGDSNTLKVASIKVTDGLFGTNGVTHVRVAVPSRNVPGPLLQQDQEGCFALKKHPSGTFYMTIPFGNPLLMSDKNYADQLAIVRKVAAARAEPMKALKGADRELAACVLVQSYRHMPDRYSQMKNGDPIPADESRLILETLANMKWGQGDNTGIGNASATFNALRLTEADGWAYPKPVQGQDFNKLMEAAATKWLEDHATTYRIHRLVEVTAKK